MSTENNAGLSEEELAALDDETDTGSPEGEEDGSQAEEGTEDKAAAADGSEGSTDADSGTGEEGDAEAEGEGEGDGTAVAQDDAGFTPTMAARDVPDDLAEQIAANDKAIADLDKKLEEGEIDYPDHIKQNRELLDKRTDLHATQRESAFVVAQNEAQATQQWNWEQSRFLEDNPAFTSPVMHGALSGALDSLYADEANKARSYRWYLQEAGRQVRDAMGVATDTPAADAPAATEEAAAAKAVQKAKSSGKSKPAVTLGALPEAAGTLELDPFSAIDNLPGMEQEAALAKMSKADQDKYLNTRVG